MSKKTYPSDKQDKFMVRMPEGMRGRIEGAAKSSGRSMNAEIVHRLIESFETPPGFEDLEKKYEALLRDYVSLQYTDEVMQFVADRFGGRDAASEAVAAAMRNAEGTPEFGKVLFALKRKDGGKKDVEAVGEGLLKIVRKFLSKKD